MIRTMSTKHTATFQGHVFTRTSVNRSYPFVVLTITNIAAAVAAYATARARSWDTNLDFHQGYADGTGPHCEGHYPDYIQGPNGPYGMNPYLDRAACRAEHDAQARKEKARSLKILAEGKDAWVARETAEYREDLLSRRLTTDGKGYITVAGWASRRDLADKLAARHAGSVVVGTSRVVK
jgi:hypothetical protein